MADSGNGIQELMAAETRASQIVAEARIGKDIKRSVSILKVDCRCRLSISFVFASSRIR